MFSPQWQTKTPTRATMPPLRRDELGPARRPSLVGGGDGLEDRLGLVDVSPGMEHGQDAAAVDRASLHLAHHLPEVDLGHDEAADSAPEGPGPLLGEGPGRPGA